MSYGVEPGKIEEMIAQAENIYRRFVNVASHSALIMDSHMPIVATQSTAALPRTALRKQNVHFAPYITSFKTKER